MEQIGSQIFPNINSANTLQLSTFVARFIAFGFLGSMRIYMERSIRKWVLWILFYNIKISSEILTLSGSYF